MENLHPAMEVAGSIPTRRERTVSTSERLKAQPEEEGVIKYFCRQKGHGFIIPKSKDSCEEIFVHISDIDDDIVPAEGDIVKYRTCLIPPKNVRFQAVHVRISIPRKDVPHQHWSDPVGADQNWNENK
ncbi:hypothetical protein SNEBB_002880 [Seison nebaliae]|nr:hypothetical protein SNEBB_002880 [Seison nebaliae]